MNSISTHLRQIHNPAQKHTKHFNPNTFIKKCSKLEHFLFIFSLITTITGETYMLLKYQHPVSAGHPSPAWYTCTGLNKQPAAPGFPIPGLPVHLLPCEFTWRAREMDPVSSLGRPLASEKPFCFSRFSSETLLLPFFNFGFGAWFGVFCFSYAVWSKLPLKWLNMPFTYEISMQGRGWETVISSCQDANKVMSRKWTGHRCNLALSVLWSTCDTILDPN